MYTLRASSGMTSSRGIFWLIPAMRRNERNGPGMLISETLPGEVLLDLGPLDGAAPDAPQAQTEPREQIRTRLRASVCARRGEFTAGSLWTPSCRTLKSRLLEWERN